MASVRAREVGRTPFAFNHKPTEYAKIFSPNRAANPGEAAPNRSKIIRLSAR